MHGHTEALIHKHTPVYSTHIRIHTQGCLFCVLFLSELYSVSGVQGIYLCFSDSKALSPLPSLISYFHASIQPPPHPPTSSAHHALSHIFLFTSLLRFNSSIFATCQSSFSDRSVVVCVCVSKHARVCALVCVCQCVCSLVFCHSIYYAGALTLTHTHRLVTFL